MKRGLIVVVTAAALIGVPLAYALLTETAVFASARNERNPAADHDDGGGQVWAFTRSRSGFPNRYDAYAKVGGNAAVKLNRAGQGWTGGLDYPIVTYQQIAAGQSDIGFYDLSTNTRSVPPVNTERWEWHPSIAGTASDYHLLFGRDNTNTPTQRVMLHHHSGTAHESRLLSYVTKASHYLQPDQVNGNYATYTRCNPVCNVFRYTIDVPATMRLTKPATDPPRHQYAAAVTSTGAVYYVRSGPRCGASVKIVRYDAALADPATGKVLAALPRGRDISFAFARENADGSVDVFYDRVNCSTGRWDIYKISDLEP